MKRLSFGFFGYLAAVSLSQAAQIGDLDQTHFLEQASRFFSFQDPSVRYAVIGALLLGLCCGLLGGFIVVRKLSLVGDTLSHAVLPGVALGFLWSATKDPLAIFIGATLAGLLGTVVVNLIKQTSIIKEDSALGLVLSGFYALGIVLITMIQRMETGSKSGINQFFFGQAAALSPDDLILMAVVTAVVVVLVFIFYKEFLVTSFDAAFARAQGLPAQFFLYLLMLLLAFAVVVSLQATGAVLVTALLVTPATAAYLLTDRMHRMLLLAGAFGMTSAFLGVFFSFLGNKLPTGPFIVLAATLIFALAYACGPRHGFIPRKLQEARRRRR
ncbi:MAG: metal ABC transporter permease, partial [Verrucomicrobiota bacterium]